MLYTFLKPYLLMEDEEQFSTHTSVMLYVFKYLRCALHYKTISVIFDANEFYFIRLICGTYISKSTYWVVLSPMIQNSGSLILQTVSSNSKQPNISPNFVWHCVLGFTNLLMEGVCVAMHRHLSSSHPVFRLLAPHFLFLIGINAWVWHCSLSPLLLITLPFHLRFWWLKGTGAYDSNYHTVKFIIFHV